MDCKKNGISYLKVVTGPKKRYSLRLCFEIQTMKISGNDTEWTGFLAKTCLYYSLDLDLKIRLLVCKSPGLLRKRHLARH